MSRRSIVVTAILLAVLAAVLPLFVLSHISRQRALASEQARLAREAERACR